ncbi:MAG TPA: MMPL family transporter, partial [Clostridia bacterium]|nr:MMPL family transporter [Clostridia bacterium]
MKKFTEFVVKNKWVFIGVFAALAIAATVMLFFNPIIYDLTVFAPKNSNTDKSLELMKEQFDDKGSAIVMVKNISLERAEELAEELSEIDGVAAAVLDATNNYKSNCALYNIMLEDYDSTDGANKTIKTLIEYLSGEEAYFSGQSAMSYYTRLETVESIIKIGAVIAVAIMAMLLFTSQTYFELLIMLIVFAVSIVLNMGTNFVFGGISYVSNLVALVLQLALSIDYSVILLHRFMEEYEIDDAETAAATALAKGIPEILSSSLTTIAGLSALILMTLPIGAEMGLSLAKGIVASLLSVLFLMPALLVIMANPLVKSRHKRFVPDITKAAKVILKGRKVIMPAFLILTVLAGTGQFYNQYSYNINGAARIINSNNKIAEVFGVQNSLVVVVPKGDYNKEKELIDFVMGKEIINNVNGIASIKVTDNLYLSDKVSAGEIIRLVYEMGFDQSGLMATVFVNAIFETHRKQTGSTNIPLSDYKMTVVDFLEAVYNDYYDYLGENAAQLELLIAARKNFEGERYSRIIFNINSDVESPESLELIGELEDELKQFYPEFYLAGESVACYDMAIAFPKD